MHTAPEVAAGAESGADPRRWWTLAVLCFSLIVISLDNTILNVALPTLQGDLGASAAELQWIVDAYMLVFAGLLLTAGALGDRFGRKRALTFGLAVFGAGSALSALSTSAEMLIAARAVMGIGGAFIMPSTLSILTATFPPAERGRAIGIWAGVAGIGIAIGPVSGGWLLEHFDWGAIFLVNLPIVAVALLAGRRLVPESRDPAAPRLDLPGFALSTAGLTALIWAIIEAPGRGWTDAVVLAAFAFAAAVLAAFVAWERRAPSPMLPVGLFRNRRFSASSAAIALAFFALFGMIFFLTQYLQWIRGYSALEAGIRTLPVAGGLILGGPLSARLAERVGTKVVVAAGLALVAAGLALLGLADEHSVYGIVALSQVVLGFGMGNAMAPATDAIMGSLPLAKASVGSAVNDATRITGGALGVAVLGSMLSTGYRGRMEDAVAGLPAPAAEAAQESLAGAMSVSRLAGPGGERLLDAAQSAFVSGMHSAALVAAAIALAGAVVALRWLPARAAAPAPEAEAAAPVAREALAA
jgi:EmrB/QacA subfamily drug resistance transporter